MIYKLKRIKKEYFDDVLDTVAKNSEKNKAIIVDNEYVENFSEEITINGKEISIDIDKTKYDEAISKHHYGYSKLAEVAMLLHKDIKDVDGQIIPKNMLYEREIWAYLSLVIFKDLIIKLRIHDPKDITYDKIARFFFNIKSISRTGLMFLWVMVDRLDSENETEITHTAFEFIDPVKAIFERTISKSPLLLRAFVEGIIQNKKDSKFKSDPYRRIIPNGVSCYEAVNMLEALDYADMVNVIAEQQMIYIQHI